MRADTVAAVTMFLRRAGLTFALTVAVIVVGWYVWELLSLALGSMP